MSKKSLKLIKWVGGKTQIIEELKASMPETYNNYYEPFIGGGALLFDLKPKNAVINDFNSELINLYNTVKKSPQKLYNELQSIDNTKENYYAIRNMDRLENYNELSKEFKAARFIFLNKKGFNGLWRVNSKGQNNVPYNGSKSESYKQKEPIESAHNYFKNNNVKILNCDFELAVQDASEGDFVYFDPPYDYENESGFTSYKVGGFDRTEQERLKKLCDVLNFRGVKFMLSNNATSFILDLYHEYNIKIVKAKRMINSKGNSRGPVDEVIITNY